MMEVFRDLTIHGDAERLARMMDLVERSLTGGWSRDRGIEEHLQGLGPRKAVEYCFACTKEGQRPAANVFFTEKEPGTLHVPNIVPRVQHRLAYGQYNALLEEFYQQFVRPAADQTGAVAELTGNQADLDRWLSRPVAEKLVGFSRSANRGTGASHPSDRERWNDFVLAAHRECSNLDASTLRRWLVEIEGWAPEVAEQLALEYEYGRELLAFAEGRRSA
jgi:hypothetical protein